MPYQLKANTTHNYVHIIYTGTVELIERQQAKDAVFEMCFDMNFHRTLVDVRDSNIQMDESDVIKFVSSFKGMKLPENYRLAGVIGTNNKSDKLIEVMISQEGINIKYFHDFQEAENWLTAI